MDAPHQDSRADWKTKKVGVYRDGSPYTDDECDEIIAKLEQLLDGELDREKEQNVIQMVNNCDYCLEQYRIEKSLRQLIREGFRNIMVKNTLVQNIKNSIQAVRRSSRNN